LTGNWLVISVERVPTLSSSTSSRSLRSAAPMRFAHCGQLGVDVLGGDHGS
jgi:hypothetical protein